MQIAVPLNHLRHGEIAEIAQLVGSPDQVRRLEELGLRGGTRLEIVRAGSPCIVRAANTKLCIRDEQALRILVTPRKIA